MLRSARALAWIALLAVCAATVTASAGEPPANEPVAVETSESRQGGYAWLKTAALYLPNRVVDFIDVWRLNVGAGLGACVNLRPTKSLQIGFGSYDSVRIGLRGRRFPLWHEWSLEGGFDGMYYELGEAERGFYEFGGTVHLLFIGLDAAVNIEEALDFGYGIFLADPANDDYR